MPNRKDKKKSLYLVQHLFDAIMLTFQKIAWLMLLPQVPYLAQLIYLFWWVPSISQWDRTHATGTDTLWMRIAMQSRKKKRKRRRIIAFILVALKPSSMDAAKKFLLIFTAGLSYLVAKVHNMIFRYCRHILCIPVRQPGLAPQCTGTAVQVSYTIIWHFPFVRYERTLCSRASNKTENRCHSLRIIYI